MAITNPTNATEDGDGFAAILDGLQRRFGFGPAALSPAALRARIRPRMALAGLARPMDYADRLAVDAGEAASLVGECLADQTGLFRDRDAFAALIETAVAPLVARVNGEREIRVWVPDCGAGEDAYALAIAFAEAEAPRVKILACDADSRLVALAAEGRFAGALAAALRPDIAARSFEREGEGVRVRDAVRRRIVFNRHDLLSDPPFARIDLVAWPSGLAARSPADRTRALNLIRSALTPGGVLCLDPADPPGDGFAALDAGRGLFVRSDERAPPPRPQADRPAASARPTEALLQAAEIGAVFLDNVAQNIWRLDRSHRVRWANAGAAQAMGLTPESAVGVDADAFMVRLDPEWRAHAGSAFASQSPHYGVEAQFKPKGEAPQWTSTDIVPDGESLSGEPSLLVVSTDITPQKERETELEVAIADADHSRRLFERHYRRTPVLLCSFQSDGRIVEASDLWRDKTGYARDEMVGRGLGEFLDEPSRRRMAEALLPSLWRTGACEAEPLRFLAKSGAAMDAELSGYLSAEDGGPPLCLAALVDVTARNAAETALEKANRELASANDGLKTFAHVASHDLQEPLRKIKQFGDLLSSEFGDKLGGDALFYIDVMRDSTDRMRRLIRDILEFSRSMNATMSRTRLALDEIVGEILSELDVAVRDAGAEVEIGRLPWLLGDRIAVQLLMRNLIGNSLKYGRPGVAPKIAIKGGWTRSGEFLLSCKDNGCGIEARYHDSIFDPFTRLHMRSEVEGSGIGLAICKSVCERQHWRIGVNSQPGEGAEFTIAIPAADVAADPRKEANLA